MATRYAGRCGVTGCAWLFSSVSPALIAELYGNHFNKVHTESAILLIEPGSLVIPWPPDSQELIRLNLAESPEQSRAPLLVKLVVLLCAAAGLGITALGIRLIGAGDPPDAEAGGFLLLFGGVVAFASAFSIVRYLRSNRWGGPRS